MKNRPPQIDGRLVQEAVLESIAAQVELAMSKHAVRQAHIYLKSRGRVSQGTIHRILHARDHRISSLCELARTLNAKVTIVFESQDTVAETSKPDLSRAS